METNQHVEKFYQAWGTLGSNWGINKTMAQIHALLLISENSLTTEDIMEKLNISRGNTNMNLRALMDWGLIQKEHKKGERKEHFVAEKDIWKVSRLIARERRKRELEPALKILEELRSIKDTDAESKRFKKQIDEVYKFTSMVDSILDKFIKSNTSWMMKIFAYIAK